MNLPSPRPARGTSSCGTARRSLVDAFADYNAEFRAVTRERAPRFEERDWHGSQLDAVERIELYSKYVDTGVELMRRKLGEEIHERSVWSSIKRRYAELIDPLPDAEFKKTYFCSITRKTFGTVGVDPAVEFFALDLDPLGSVTTHVETKDYLNRGSVDLLIEELLADFRFRDPVPRLRAEREAGGGRDQGLARHRRRATHGREDRGHQGGLLPDDPRLPRRPDQRPRVDAALRRGAAQPRERRGRRRRHARREHGERAVQLHPLVLPRRPRARRRGREVPQGDPAAQAGERAVHGARPRQAGQDRALPRAVPPPAALGRPVRAGAGREGAGDGVLHAALLRRRLQADPRPVPGAEEHPARRTCSRSTTSCSSTTAPDAWSTPRSSSSSSSRSRGSRRNCSRNC